MKSKGDADDAYPAYSQNFSKTWGRLFVEKKPSWKRGEKKARSGGEEAIQALKKAIRGRGLNAKEGSKRGETVCFLNANPSFFRNSRFLGHGKVADDECHRVALILETDVFFLALFIDLNDAPPYGYSIRPCDFFSAARS